MKMKKIFTAIALAILISGWFSAPAFAQEQEKEISVLVDGLPVAFDVQPVIRDGRTLVPFRSIAEILNIAVTWDNSTQTVSASGRYTDIRLQIGNNTAHLNNAPIFLDVPPVIQNGRTLIPLRFFSEAFGCKVDWDSSINGARIISPRREMTVIGFYALGDRQTSSWTDLFGKVFPETAATGNTDAVGELALGWYSLDKQGNLLTASKQNWVRPDSWQTVLAAAGKHGLKTEMVVQLTDGEDIISSLLVNEAAMTKAVSFIMQEAKLYGGVNLDFEGLGYQVDEKQLPAVQENFSRFALLLSQKLRPAGKTLTLTIHPPNSVYKGYDYRSLGKAADKIIIMAYDYGSKPEPADLVNQAVEMAKSAVPPEKLILGISAPSETPESIIDKIGIAKKHKLNGIALWRLGVISDRMWESLRSSVKPNR